MSKEKMERRCGLNAVHIIFSRRAAILPAFTLVPFFGLAKKMPGYGLQHAAAYSKSLVRYAVAIID